MSGPKCSCDKFERLEGASVGAYTAAFLEDLGREEAAKKRLYRCRSCGRLWEKRAPEKDARSTRPSLVKVDEQ
jgi:hypothetical protein